MYIGTYYHKLEEKGRVSVPVKFRNSLGEKPVLTRGLDGCLFLFSQQDWATFITTLEDSNVTKKVHRDFVRLMANEASELEFDVIGRAVIPEYLRNKANITKEIVFTGSANRVELWDRDAYHTYMESLEQHAEDVAEQFGVPQKGDDHV